MIKYLASLLILLSTASAVSSKQTPVSRRFFLNALQGNDQSDGLTPATAWRTLARANQQTFAAGDSLLLHAAMIFEGQLKPVGSGRLQQPIVLSSYGQGTQPEIQGNGMMPAALYLYNVEHWTVHNIKITNFGAGRVASRYGILVKINNFGVAAGIHIIHTSVTDVNGSLVKKEGGGAAIVFANGGDKKYSWFDDISIEHCTLQRTARNGILINGYWQRNNWHPNLHVRIQHNLLEGIPGDGIVPIGCDSALIEYNTMRNCPRLLPPGEAAAGIWPWSCDNTVVQYNEVSDHKAPWDAQGFDSDWNCRNTLIQYNYSHDNEGGFLLVCNDGGVKMPISAGNTGTIVRFNVSCNDGFRTSGKDSGFSPVIHIPGPARNTHIYNNLIYISNRNGLCSDSTLIAFDNWGGYADSTVFSNNIFYTTTPVDYQYGKAKGITFSNNLYYGVHIGKPQDAQAVLEDPAFQQLPLAGKAGWASLKAFLLSKHSPAIGAGKAVTEQSAKDLYDKKMQPPGTTNIGVDAF